MIVWDEAYLNATYGECLPPEKEVRAWEEVQRPSTCRRLDPATGAWLQQYLDMVPQHDMAGLLARTTAILWVMDVAGDVHFAQEEVYRENGMALAFVFPRRFLSLPEGLIKLGHPSLLPPGSKLARCGGDITYDPDLGSENLWVITFNSGRYGEWNRPHLTSTVLQAVADRFRENGVSLSPYL